MGATVVAEAKHLGSTCRPLRSLQGSVCPGTLRPFLYFVGVH